MGHLGALFPYQPSEPTPIVLTGSGCLAGRKQRAGFQPGKWRQVFWVQDICSGLKEMSAWSRFRSLELGVTSRSCFQAGLGPCHWCSAFCCVLQPPSSRCLRCCRCCAIRVCHRHCCFPAGKLLLLWTAASASSSCKAFPVVTSQLPNSPINLEAPEAEQSEADTVLGWRDSPLRPVPALTSQACHGLQPLCSAKFAIRL